jgi:hypothetical protein
VSNPTEESDIVFLKFHPGSTTRSQPAAGQISIKVGGSDVD